MRQETQATRAGPQRLPGSVSRLLRGLAVGFAAIVILSIAAFLFERLHRAEDIHRYLPPGRMVDVGGRRLHLLCVGRGRPTVILETGSGTPSILFWPLQRRIANFTRVCSYDRANYGWSDPAPLDRTFYDSADDLHRLLARGGEHAPFVLVGESLGGLVARAFAAAHPRDVVGLVLVDAVEDRYARETLLPRGDRARLEIMLSELGIVRYAILLAPSLTPTRLSADQRSRFAALMSRPSHWREAGNLIPLQRMPAAGFGSLGALPLTVIRHGLPSFPPAVENVWPAAQARLTALSTDSAEIVAKSDHHLIAEEDPDVVASAVRDMVLRLRVLSGKGPDNEVS